MIRGKVAFGLDGQERYPKALDFDFVMGIKWGFLLSTLQSENPQFMW